MFSESVPHVFDSKRSFAECSVPFYDGINQLLYTLSGSCENLDHDVPIRYAQNGDKRDSSEDIR